MAKVPLEKVLVVGFTRLISHGLLYAKVAHLLCCRHCITSTAIGLVELAQVFSFEFVQGLGEISGSRQLGFISLVLQEQANHDGDPKDTSTFEREHSPSAVPAAGCIVDQAVDIWGWQVAHQVVDAIRK